MTEEERAAKNLLGAAGYAVFLPGILPRWQHAASLGSSNTTGAEGTPLAPSMSKYGNIRQWKDERGEEIAHISHDHTFRVIGEKA